MYIHTDDNNNNNNDNVYVHNSADPHQRSAPRSHGFPRPPLFSKTTRAFANSK